MERAQRPARRARRCAKPDPRNSPPLVLLSNPGSDKGIHGDFVAPDFLVVPPTPGIRPSSLDGVGAGEFERCDHQSFSALGLTHRYT